MRGSASSGSPSAGAVVTARPKNFKDLSPVTSSQEHRIKIKEINGVSPSGRLHPYTP